MGDPNIVKCCVPLCKATSENTRTVSFHQFPKSENLKAEWVQVLKDIEIYDKMLSDKGSDSISEWHICSRHFTSDDFEKNDTTGQLKKSTGSNQETLVKRSLCYDAVPSVFAVTCMNKKKKLGNSIKKIQMKRKASFQGRLSGNGAPNPKKMKEKDDEKPISISRMGNNNNKIMVTSSSPVVNLKSKGTPQNTSEISAKMENIVNKMELTTKPRPLPSTGRKPIPGVPDQVNSRMENAVMQWLCLPQNIHAPYKPEPVPLPKATSSNKLASKQGERRSPRAVVVSQSQPTHRVHISPKSSLANVAKRLVVSKSPPVVLPVTQRNIQKPTTSTSVTVPRQSHSQVKQHKPPKITVTNATKKPSKQNIQNAEPERKQPGTVHSMLTHAISKVFASPSTGRSKQNQKRVYYSKQQINTIDGLLCENPPLISIVTAQRNKVRLGKSSNIKRHDKKKRKELETDDIDSTSDSDQSGNVEYVNGQVPWEAEDDDEGSETYENDNLNSMEAEVPDENIIDYDSYSNSIRLPNHSVLDMSTNGADDESNIQQDPLAILKYEVIEENDDDGVNDPSNEYSTPLLNGFEFGMSEEDSTTILSAPAASCAVTAVLESANSNNDPVDVGVVKVEDVKMEYLSDDENVESCAIVPETQIDGNNPGYSCAVTTTLTEGTIPDVQVKTEPELISS